MRSVQSKGEIAVDLKTSQQSLTNAEIEVECVVIKNFGVKTVRQKKLGSRCCEGGVRTFRSSVVMDCKLNGECIIM